MKQIAHIYIKDEFGENAIVLYTDGKKIYKTRIDRDARLVYGTSPFKLNIIPLKDTCKELVEFMKMYICNYAYTEIGLKDKGTYNSKKVYIININKEIFIGIRKGYCEKFRKIIDLMYKSDSMKWKEDYSEILKEEDEKSN